MASELSNLFNAFDRGVISRRQLLQALGIAVAIKPAAAIAQGQCGGANKGTPECNTTPAKLPFEPTGWKTVMLDHFSCQCVDYAKEAAYYQALMNWKIRSDDGKQAVLDIGDWGGLDPARRLRRAAATAGRPRCRRAGCRRCRRRTRRPGRRAASAAQRRVRRHGVGHRQVGREESRSRVEGARPLAGRRQSRRLPELPRQGSGRLRSSGSPTATATIAARAPASGKTSAPAPFESTDLEDGVARSHLVRSHELQGDGGVLSRAARLEARRRRRQPEHDGHRRPRRRHHPPRQPRRSARAGGRAAPRWDTSRSASTSSIRTR